MVLVMMDRKMKKADIEKGKGSFRWPVFLERLRNLEFSGFVLLFYQDFGTSITYHWKAHLLSFHEQFSYSPYDDYNPF